MRNLHTKAAMILIATSALPYSTSSSAATDDELKAYNYGLRFLNYQRLFEEGEEICIDGKGNEYRPSKGQNVQTHTCDQGADQFFAL